MERAHQCCSNCNAFVRDGTQIQNPPMGQCRRKSPTVVMLTRQVPPPPELAMVQGTRREYQVVQTIDGAWPPVRGDLWCAEWRDREIARADAEIRGTPAAAQWAREEGLPAALANPFAVPAKPDGGS